MDTEDYCEVKFYNGGPLDGGLLLTSDKPECGTILCVAEDDKVEYVCTPKNVIITSKVHRILKTDEDVYPDLYDKTLHSYLFNNDGTASYHGTYTR